MSIDPLPHSTPKGGAAAPSWGEVVTDGQPAAVLRIVLPERVVTYPAHELSRWEHTLGDGECLLLSFGREIVTIEGQDLHAIRAALDTGKLTEVRSNHTKPARPGPRIARIAIEPA